MSQFVFVQLYMYSLGHQVFDLLQNIKNIVNMRVKRIKLSISQTLVRLQESYYKRSNCFGGN